jgi:aryl-alcohol dehydrogenase-like predicted oxidoreductase
LGCMTFGDTSRGFNEWALDDAAAEPIFRQALVGITFWDTANVYGFGTSEEIVGRAIHKYTRREDIVLATKVVSRCTTAQAPKACPARRSWSRSTPRSPGSAPSTSTSTRSIVSMQNQYSLMQREEEREMFGLHGREFGATDVVAERADEGIARIRDLTGGPAPARAYIETLLPRRPRR